MWDIITDSGAAPVTVCVTGLVLGYVLWMGRKEQLHRQKGWRYVVSGIALLFLAGVVDTTDEFVGLKKYIILGDTASQTFVETVWYIGGATLFLFGFLHWLPVVGALRKAEQDLTGEIEERIRAEDGLRKAFDEVEMRVKERTAELSVEREELQALSRRLVALQEAERRQIARDLHDEIGQTLTGLKLSLEMIPSLSAGAFRTNLEKARMLADELMTQVHDLSLDLRPAMLDDLGLLPTLLWYFERYTVQTDVKVNFERTGVNRRFPPEVETAAYRIVQAALTNVALHANVNEVVVRTWASQSTLSVQVEDQGTGFAPDAVLAGGATSGLPGMRERAVLLGGHLEVESAPGAGTRLTAELPLSNPSAGGYEEEVPK